MDKLSYIILVPMVYAAAAVFLIGMAARLYGIYTAPENPSTLTIYPRKKHPLLLSLHDTFLLPAVRRHKPVLWVFLMVFHAGLLLLAIGHIELFATLAPLRIIPHDIFIGGAWLGLALTLCVLYFLFRRFFAPVRELSVPEDYLLLVLLFLAVLFGCLMNWARNWYGYGEFGAEAYRDYLLSLLRFRPEVPYDIAAGGHSFMVVMHVFFANLFLMVFPFSQLMHAVFSLPMNKLRRGYHG